MTSDLKLTVQIHLPGATKGFETWLLRNINKAQVLRGSSMPTSHSPQPLTTEIPYDTLSPALRKTLQLIADAGPNGINTLELLQAGCLACANHVYTLRERGAAIRTKKENATDAHGNVHPRVARYILDGWSLTEEANQEVAA